MVGCADRKGGGGIVLGAQEKEARSLNMRNRDDPASQTKGEMVPLDEALEKFCRLKAERRLGNRL